LKKRTFFRYFSPPVFFAFNFFFPIYSTSSTAGSPTTAGTPTTAEMTATAETPGT
jgi:hypothetical protein